MPHHPLASIRSGQKSSKACKEVCLENSPQVPKSWRATQKTKNPTMKPQQDPTAVGKSQYVQADQRPTKSNTRLPNPGMVAQKKSGHLALVVAQNMRI
jgi:hypothetical protein